MLSYGLFPVVILIVLPSCVHALVQTITMTSTTPPIRALADTNNPLIVMRKLGGYERLLSRTTPQQTTLSLSHGSMYTMKGYLEQSILQQAVCKAIQRHPMLRVFLKDENWLMHRYDVAESLSALVVQSIEVSSSDFPSVIKNELEKSLNKVRFDEGTPLWRLLNIIDKQSNRSAFVFTFNHGIDDQQSVNILVTDILKYASSLTSTTTTSSTSIAMNTPIQSLPFPLNVERAICPGLPNLKTIAWAIYQLYNSLCFPILIPNRIRKRISSESPQSVESLINPNTRSTICEFITLSAENTEKIKQKSKVNSVTVTNTLAAAILVVTSALMQDSNTTDEYLKLRFLLSVGLRSYGVGNSTDWTKESIACAGGAIDFNIDVPTAITTSFTNIIQGNVSQLKANYTANTSFWNMAQQCQQFSTTIRECGFVPEATRLFGIGMNLLDILRVVEIDAASKSTLGRGYTCGVSSVGVISFPNVKINENTQEIRVDSVYYGTSHSRNGVMCLLSCNTIDNVLSGCLQFPAPIVNRNEAVRVRQALEHLLCNL